MQSPARGARRISCPCDSHPATPTDNNPIPNTGMYGRSNSVYGPYGGYGRAASYNPQTGTYARGSAVWDNDEIAGSAVAGKLKSISPAMSPLARENSSAGTNHSIPTRPVGSKVASSEWRQVPGKPGPLAAQRKETYTPRRTARHTNMVMTSGINRTKVAGTK